MPICQTVEEFQCSHQITQSVKENSTCLPACNQIDFSMDYEYQEGLDDPNAKRNVTFAYKISNLKMKVEQEYLVHDFVGMLGSIGGTLGLFLGFSFSGILSFIFDHLQIFMENTSAKKIDPKTLTMKDQRIIQVSSQNNQDISSSTITDLVSKMNEMETEVQALRKHAQKEFWESAPSR